jgi:hypothetical protein
MNNTENITQACLHCHGNGEFVYDSTVSDTICQLCGKWQESTPLDNFADEAYTLLSKLNALVNKTIKKTGDNRSFTLIFTCDDGVAFDVEAQNDAYDFFNQRGVDVTRFNEQPTKDIANKVFGHFIQDNQLWLSQILDVDSLAVLTLEFVCHQNSIKTFTCTTALLSFSRT